MTTDENLSMTPDNDKAPQRRKRPRKGPIVGFLLLLFLLAGIGAGAWWYLFLRFEESTDDAYVAGNVLRIMPQVSGKVVAVDVDDNDMVAAGQTLVRLDPVDARLAYERSLVALASAVRDNCRLQAQLRETEAAIRMRRVDLRQKADNLTRREALGKAKAIGAEELKHARDDRENAAVALAAAEEERNALAAVLLDTGLAEQPAVRQAAANVRDCWLALQRTTVLSRRRADRQTRRAGWRSRIARHPAHDRDPPAPPVDRRQFQGSPAPQDAHRPARRDPRGHVRRRRHLSWPRDRLLRRDGQRLLPPAAPERHRQLDQDRPARARTH